MKQDSFTADRRSIEALKEQSHPVSCGVGIFAGRTGPLSAVTSFDHYDARPEKTFAQSFVASVCAILRPRGHNRNTVNA
jgi:hypothetical protein